MLRRNFSFPMGVDQLPKLSLLNASRTRSMYEFTIKPDRRITLSSLERETVWRNSFLCRQEPTCWEKNYTSPVTSSPNFGVSSEHLCASLQELRSYDEEKEECEESLFLDKYDAVYVSEEERTMNSSDLNVEEKNQFIAELVHSQNCLKRLNADLQTSLDMSDDCIMPLIAENTDLKNQIKGMKQSIQDAQQLWEELENLRTEKLERERLLCASETKCKQLEKQNETLKEQMEGLSSEMSTILCENEVHKRKISELSKLLKALQQQLEEYRLHLNQKEELINKRDFAIQQLECSVSEYSTIFQDLKEKIKDLESQLSWAVVNGGEGSFVYFDGTLSAATQRSISLREELGLLPGGQMDCHSEEDKEDQVYEEEDGKENEESKNEQSSTAEDIPIEEEASHLQAPIRWLKKNTENVKGVLTAAGVMGLGFVIPLGLLGVTISTFYEGAGPSCADLIWNTAHNLIKPYCKIHHTFPPPV